MNNSHRKYLIVGNWKMNTVASDAEDLAKEIVETVGKDTEIGIAVCPPFPCLSAVARTISDSNIHLGAQNMNAAPSGAYTGEVSAEMLRHHFCNFVILGHSERRALMGETDDQINKKVLSALKNNLKPILCVGETLADRESEKTITVVKEQLLKGLEAVDLKLAEKVVVAYEPVWAIGTGKTATPEMAQEVHQSIRTLLQNRFSPEMAQKIRILYGGSMKPNNAEKLLKESDIDGGLIGGASLQAKSFCQIVGAASKQVV